MLRIVPPSFISGDSFFTSYKPTNPDYLPIQGWTLTLSLRGENVADFDAVVNSNDNSYEFDLSTTDLSLLPGTYSYSVYLSKTNKRQTVESGQVQIVSDMTKETEGTDFRTHEEKMLVLIEAHLEKRAKGQIDHLLTTIDGKTLQRMNTNEVLDLRNRYKSMVNRQKRGLFPKKIKYNFVGSNI